MARYSTIYVVDLQGFPLGDLVEVYNMQAEGGKAPPIPKGAKTPEEISDFLGSEDAFVRAPFAPEGVYLFRDAETASSSTDTEDAFEEFLRKTFSHRVSEITRVRY